MLREYHKAIDIYTRWQNPPLHMYIPLAVNYGQLDRMDEARAALNMFNENRPPDADFSFYAATHAGMCRQSEDAEHWLEGYRKIGLVD